MNKIFANIIKIALLLSLLGFMLAGCATRTGQATRNYDENWRFVPSIHGEDISFGVTTSEYRGCTYDNRHDGYWCPVK